MNVFNEDTRVKIPATVQVLRLGYDYQSMKEAEIDFDTKVFISRFKSSLIIGIFLTKRSQIYSLTFTI